MDPFVEIEIGGESVASRAEALPSRDGIRNGNESLKPEAARSKVYSSEPIRPTDNGQRARFSQMREIARHPSVPRLNFNAVFYNQEQRDALALIFLRQARFMEDFVDEFNKTVPFSSYYPIYQMMDYEQLRTYFTWRTHVREGYVGEASASYGFLYVYELINQVGTGGSTQGLLLMLEFWRAFRRYTNVLDKHVLRWFKDYHVYYDIPGYGDFLVKNGLDPVTGVEDRFSFFCGISNYNITGGGYYGEENAALIREACLYVIDELTEAVRAAEGDFNALLFPGSPPKLIWKPFAHALFVPDTGRPESLTVLSNDEIYIYRRQVWTCREAKHGNRRLIGYIFKKTEECLRRLTRFKRSLTAELDMIEQDTLRTLQLYGVYPDRFVEERTAAFYAEKNKIVVSVDKNALVKIREEAQETQERLTVEEGRRPDGLGQLDGAQRWAQPGKWKSAEVLPVWIPPEATLPGGESPVVTGQNEVKQPAEAEYPDPWAAFALSLTPLEREALQVILNGGSFKAFADAQGVMAEVLTEGINEKAVDAVGDTLIEYDGQASVYEEYTANLKASLNSVQ